ncbi:glycosyltransferase family 2 protein [Aeromonas allosaccharophila]|uniref:Glycosyltransferase family 2 protein n=1 Tax=Aeromonas allosaccharophila TaxID=656 RepID=A0A7T2PG84_9GAMM|nr:glycosyltransferase family 2 protein [Aeromonas allosaccharophila]QPR55092.1 glycosyltransferase family 2 protein [Aeromonas allosaccharophila]
MIDIVIATYNPSVYLLEQIDSILSQEAIHKVSRIIIVDDSSVDTKYLKLAIKKDSRIEFYNNDSGRNGAKNNFSYGLSLTSAAFVMTCDQDDVWLPHKVELSLDTIMKLDGNYPCLVSTDVMVVDSELSVIHESFLNYKGVKLPQDARSNNILYRNIFPGCSMIFNRKLLDIALPIPEEAIMHDWWLISVASLIGQTSYCLQPTMLYRQHDSNCIGAKQSSLLSAFKARSIMDNLSLLEKHYLSIKMQNRVIYERFMLGENKSVNSELETFLHTEGILYESLKFSKYLRMGFVKSLLYFCFISYKKIFRQ